MNFKTAEDHIESRTRRMFRHTFLVVIGGGLAMTGLLAAGFYYASQPTILRVAVGPPNSDDLRVIQAIAQQFSRDRATIRLRVIVKDGPVQSAAALDAGEADLAVVRRDRGLPQAGQAVAILRKNLVVFIAPPPAPAPAAPKAAAKKAKKPAAKETAKDEDKKGGEKDKDEDVKKLKLEELAGKRIAVIGRTEANINLLNVILSQYAIPLDKVQITQLDTTDVGPAIRDSKVDVIMSVGPLGSRITADAVAAAARDREAPTFLA